VALRAVAAAGRSVPRDISLVGFDDIDLAQWTDPPLTTISQQKAEMGRWAFARVSEVDGLAAAPERIRTVRLATRLVVRASTAPPTAVDRGR
jgi:DNA-binding LacI/PurR family transcriptional regulator